MGYVDILLINILLLIIVGSFVLFGVFVFFLFDMLLKSIGKMDIKVMFGLDVLILLCDKNFFVFFFCLFLFVMLLVFYYIFVNGYLIEVGMKNVIGWMMFG